MLSQKNRLISDNILVAFETLHSMKNHKTSKNGYMALKLDMSKAYDMVEWSFLEEIMRRLGFVERWTNLMMLCVKTVSYSILVNSKPKGEIQPSRGPAKATLYPHLLSYCALKGYIVSFPKRRVMEKLRATPLVDEAQD